MSNNFSSLVAFYKKCEQEDNNPRTFFCNINSSLELDEINTIYQEVCNYKEVNTSQKLRLGENRFRINDKRIFRDINDFIKKDFLRTKFSSEVNTIDSAEYYFVKEKESSFDKDNNRVINRYFLLKLFIKKMYDLSYYSNDKNLIFFSNKNIEVSLEPTDNIINETINILSSINELQNDNIIKFINWLEQDNVKTHFDEVKSIFSNVLVDVLSNIKKVTLINVLQNMDRIIEYTRGQFLLYLENFKYEKLIDKIGENSEKFIEKINDIINKAIAQILGLPIFIAIGKFIDSDYSTIKVIIFCFSVILYCLIIFDNSKKIDFIKEKFYIFESELPTELENQQWSLSKNFIRNRIKFFYQIQCILKCSLILIISYILICNFIMTIIHKYI